MEGFLASCVRLFILIFMLIFGGFFWKGGGGEGAKWLSCWTGLVDWLVMSFGGWS